MIEKVDQCCLGPLWKPAERGMEGCLRVMRAFRFGCGGGYTGVCICQNSRFTLWVTSFESCKLYLNQVDFKGRVQIIKRQTGNEGNYVQHLWQTVWRGKRGISSVKWAKDMNGEKKNRGSLGKPTQPRQESQSVKLKHAEVRLTYIRVTRKKNTMRWWWACGEISTRW